MPPAQLRVKGFEIKDGERVKDVNFLQQMMVCLPESGLSLVLLLTGR